jgi:hypothetical protein
MDRREVLRRVAMLTGASVVGGELFLLTGCKTDSQRSNNSRSISNAAFSKDQIALLHEIGGTILPAPQGSIGAKDTDIGEFMAMMVKDCYNAKDNEIFKNGLEKIASSFKEKFNTDFVQGSPEQKLELLTVIDKEARDYRKSKKSEDPEHFFTMMRQLTILGFATSKRGATEVFNYVAVPGKFDGDYKYKKGDKVWF